MVTVQSDVDNEESEELVFTDPDGLSEDDSGQTDTRSEEDNSAVELSGAEQGTNDDSSEAVESRYRVLDKRQLLEAIMESMDDIKPKENMDEVERNQLREAIRASLEERGQVPDTPPSTPELTEDRPEVPTDRLSPLGAVPKKESKTESRPVVCSEQEVDLGPTGGDSNPEFASPMDCILRLAICAQRLERHQQKEAMAVMRYLMILEESRGSACGRGQGEQDEAEDAGQPRMVDRDEPRRRETECRPCSKSVDRDEIPPNRTGLRSSRPLEGALKSKNLDKDGGKPWRNSSTDSKAKRFQRSADRREEQARSPSCRCPRRTCGKQHGRTRENSGSLLPSENPARYKESRTEPERLASTECSTCVRTAEPVSRRELRGSPATRAAAGCHSSAFHHGDVPAHPSGLMRTPRQWQRGHAQGRERPRGHARGKSRDFKSRLQGSSHILPAGQARAAEFHHAQQTGSNRNKRGGRNGA